MLFVVERKDRDFQLNNFDDEACDVYDQTRIFVVANCDDYDEIFSDTKKRKVEEVDQMNQLDVFRHRTDRYLNGEEKKKGMRMFCFEETILPE